MQGQPSVQFSFFDVGSWEPRLFTATFRGNIAQGLLTEDDVRVTRQGQGQAPPVPLSGGSG